MKYLLLTLAVVFIGGCQTVATKNTDSGVPNIASDIREVSPEAAQVAVSKAYSQFIDVRTPDEYSAGHATRAVNIPLDTLNANLDKLEKNEPVYVICQTGNRSKKAAVMLKEAGFNNILNVTGGTSASEATGLPMGTQQPHNVPPKK